MSNTVELIADKQWYKHGGNFLSYNYVWCKSQMLAAWLDAAGYAWRREDVRSERMYGSAKGYDVYLGLVDAVEFYCRLYRVTCDALIRADFAPHEGCAVTVMWDDCRTSSGIVMVKGKYIRYVELVKLGNKKGRKLMPWDASVAGVWRV